MYLSRLNQNQKELFLDLCIHASMSDNDYSEAEKQSIQLYCEEMQLTDFRYDAKTTADDALAKLIVSSTETELRIITFELSALVLADNHYDEREAAFMDKIVKTANINTPMHEEMLQALQDLTAIYDKLNSIILG